MGRVCLSPFLADSSLLFAALRVCNLQLQSSTQRFDLYIFACYAKFFIVRDYQVLPRAFSNVELGCTVGARRGSLPEPRGRPWVHTTQNTSIVSH